MKTKIVYVVVSNDADIYLEQTLLSAYSARLHMPDAEIILVVDNLTDVSLKGKRNTILEYVTSKIVVPLADEYNNMQRSRILKTTLRECIKGDFLYVDSDTIITSSLEEIDLFDQDIGAVFDAHVPMEKNPSLGTFQKYAKQTGWPIDKEYVYYNGGVFYVKDNDRTRLFFKTWNDYWHIGKSLGLSVDQPALAMANQLNNHLIRELPGIWNCQVNHGLKYLKDSKIIHYLCTVSLSTPLFEFMDTNLYLNIKKEGYVDNKTVRMLENPRFCFSKDMNISIIYGADIPLLETDSAILLRSLYTSYNKVFRFIELVSRNLLRLRAKFPNRSILK